MSVFKNTQVAKLFKVSNTTVTNWIEAAEKGKVDLELTSIGKRKLIIDNTKNRQIIQRLVEKGKKHIGRSDRIFIKSNSELYKTFNSRELSEIYNSVESRKIVPYKYTYFGIGANLWDKNYQMSAINTVITPNNDVKDEQSLIEKNIQKIIIEIQKYNRVNIIDIGCGNGVPVLEIIERLKQDKKEVIYTAVDISKEMIEIALSEVSKKNPNVLIKSILLDLEYANLSEYLLTSSSSDTVNLLLLLGGTLGNYNKDKSIVRILRESMTSNDYLLIGNALVNENSNIYPYEANSYHYTRTTWIPDLLGLNGHYVENRINEVNVSKSQEYREIRFSSNITTSVTVNEVEYPLSFNEGDTILVYQFFWYGEAELVNTVIQHNFSIVHFTTNKERTYGLMFVSPTK